MQHVTKFQREKAIWWNDQCSRQCCFYFFERDPWHRRRIELFSKVPFILEQSEWSIAKDDEPFSRRFTARHCQTFNGVENVYVFNIGSICINGKELLRHFAFHKNTGRDLTLMQMFEISEKWILEQSDEICGEWIQLTRIVLHGNSYLLSMMKKSSVSRIQRFMYSQILSNVLERWIRTHNQILSGRTSWRGSKVHHNTEPRTHDGEPMEVEWNIFPGYTTLVLVLE